MFDNHQQTNVLLETVQGLLPRWKTSGNPLKKMLTYTANGDTVMKAIHIGQIA